jgi:hypothetical protein
MLRKIAIALAAASLLGAAAIPTDALAFGRGGGFHGGFGGGGFSRGFAGRGFGPGFRGHRFGPGIGLGLGLGYGAYSSCYAWTPYGRQWVCGYGYPYPY